MASSQGPSIEQLAAAAKTFLQVWEMVPPLQEERPPGDDVIDDWEDLDWRIVNIFAEEVHPALVAKTIGVLTAMNEWFDSIDQGALNLLEGMAPFTSPAGCAFLEEWVACLRRLPIAPARSRDRFPVEQQ